MKTAITFGFVIFATMTAIDVCQGFGATELWVNSAVGTIYVVLHNRIYR